MPKKTTSPTTEVPYAPHVEQAAYWIVERDKIRERREKGLPPPWTDDARMASTRWCNVRRMDDRVSKWLLNNYYVEDLSAPQMAVGASMARLFNRPETLEKLCPNGFVGFDQKRFRKVLSGMADAGEQIFTGVYIINGANANGRRKWELVLDNLTVMHKELTSRKPKIELDCTSMENTHIGLMAFEGLGSFLAGQVVADMRHVVHPIKGQPEFWQDRMVWAPQGPGSTKGLNYIFNTPNRAMRQPLFLELMKIYVSSVMKNKAVAAVAKDRQLEAHDWQNSLCEVSKFARVLDGGRSKNKYDAEKLYGAGSNNPQQQLF